MTNTNKLSNWLTIKVKTGEQRDLMLEELKKVRKSKCSSYELFGIEGAMFWVFKPYNYYQAEIMASSTYAPKDANNEILDYNFKPTPEQIESERVISFSFDRNPDEENIDFDMHRKDFDKFVKEFKNFKVD